MLIDYNTKKPNEIYNLVASCVIPRPIAWISTYNNDGSVNLAPFSYFTPLSSNPATMMVSIGHKTNGELKDTLKNLKNNKFCTINMASPEFLELLHQSSYSYEYNESEVEKLSIKTEKINAFFPPIVSGVPVAFFCEFHSTIDLDGSKTIPTIVQIKEQYIDDSVVSVENSKYTIDFEPLARVAREYAKLGKRIKTPPLD